MPKLKTHKGAAKRFRRTASGKFKRGHSHARHILTKKSNKRKRFLDIDVLVSEGDQKRVEKMLPYGRDLYGLAVYCLRSSVISRLLLSTNCLPREYYLGDWNYA